MERISDLALAFLIGYVIPMVISIGYAFVGKKENPFKKGTQSHDFVFMPVINVVCALFILYYFLFKLPTLWIVKLCRKIKKGFERWNKE